MVLDCPLCHKTVTVPKGGLAALPVGRYGQDNEVLEICKKIISTSPPLCNSCEGHALPSVAYCSHCQDCLCEKCTCYHQKLRFTRTHALITKKDAKQKLDLGSASLCTNHPDRTLDLYCLKCSIPICIKCTIGHSQHGMVELTTEAAKKQEKLTNSMNGMNDAIELLRRVISKGKDLEDDMAVCKHGVDEAIRWEFAKLQLLIAESQQAMLDQSSKVAEVKISSIFRQLKKFRRLKQAMGDCLHHTNVAKENKNKAEFLEVAPSLQAEAERLLKQFSQTNLVFSEDGSIRVSVRDLDSFAADVPLLGRTITAESGNKSSIAIYSFANVSDKNSPAKRDVIVASVRDRGDLSYLLSMRLQEGEEQSLSLKLGDQHIPILSAQLHDSVSNITPLKE